MVGDGAQGGAGQAINFGRAGGARSWRELIELVIWGVMIFYGSRREERRVVESSVLQKSGTSR